MFEWHKNTAGRTSVSKVRDTESEFQLLCH